MAKRLMQLAEEEVLARGCHAIPLDMHDFQARSFYERPGYVQSGELPDFSVDHSRTFLKKALGTYGAMQAVEFGCIDCPLSSDMIVPCGSRAADRSLARLGPHTLIA